MKTNAKTIVAAITLGCAILAVSCKKNETTNPSSAQTAPYSMYMTDAPSQYEAVNINITGVEVYAGGAWENLNVIAGTYNLLTLCNGKDTLIASGMVTPGAVTQVRLLLGASGHSVVVSGVSYPLALNATDEAGLTLTIQSQTAASGTTTITTVDFDAGLSVVYTGNNTYKLKPVLRRVIPTVTGDIKGTISPTTAEAAILVSSALDSAYSFSSTFNGEFTVQGLASGTYNVTILPAPPYAIKTYSGIIVTNGSATSMGSISLD
jgi:hypothetical protein